MRGVQEKPKRVQGEKEVAKVPQGEESQWKHLSPHWAGSWNQRDGEGHGRVKRFSNVKKNEDGEIIPLLGNAWSSLSVTS